MSEMSEIINNNFNQLLNFKVASSITFLKFLSSKYWITFVASTSLCLASKTYL